MDRGGASTESDESFNLSKNFAANKGRLPMPVTGTATIVGNFGVKRHDEWNITTNGNGVDIQAQQSTASARCSKGRSRRCSHFLVPTPA